MNIRNLDAYINKKASSNEILDFVKFELVVIGGIFCFKVFI